MPLSFGGHWARNTESELREQESNLPVMSYETIEPPLLYSRVKLGGDEGSRTLIVRFTRPTLFCIQLSYIAVEDFGGLGEIQTLTRSLQDFYAVSYITSP